MGISLSFLPFFDACSDNGAIRSPMLGLGTVKIYEEQSVLKTFADQNGYKSFTQNFLARTLFLDRYGIEDFQCGEVPIYQDTVACQTEIDLSKKFPTYQSILNSGELEHLFDQKVAFMNLHNMTVVGGSMIHIAPVTWLNHSFYNLNPFFYRELARANNYEIVVEAIHSREPLFGEEPKQPRCYFTRLGGKPTEYARGLQDLMRQSYLPSSLLYMVALIKTSAAQFEIPREPGDFRYAEDTNGNCIPVSYTSHKVTPLKIETNNVAKSSNISAPGSNVMEILSDVVEVEFILPSSQIGHDSGHCYTYHFQSQAGKVYSRLAKGLPLAITEDDCRLSYDSSSHDDIRSLGEGRSSLWNDHIYFSTTDNSDPRTNGKKYSVRVPGFVHFIEKLPISGIKKFGV